MFKRIARVACAAGTLILAAPVLAEHSTRVGDFTIQHNAFPAATLSPEIARAYGIQGGKNRGVLNVSVIKDRPGTTGSPVRALVDVDLVDGNSRKGRVPMKEVEAQGAVSYLGEFPIADGQDLEFEIKVRPTGATETTTVRMRQEFFTD